MHQQPLGLLEDSAAVSKTEDCDINQSGAKCDSFTSSCDYLYLNLEADKKIYIEILRKEEEHLIKEIYLIIHQLIDWLMEWLRLL